MRKRNLKLTRKNNRAIRRQVDLDLGVEPYKSKIHKNKKKYNRKNKYKDDWEESKSQCKVNKVNY